MFFVPFVFVPLVLFIVSVVPVALCVAFTSVDVLVDVLFVVPLLMFVESVVVLVLFVLLVLFVF